MTSTHSQQTIADRPWTMAGKASLRLLGDFQFFLDGEPVRLPPAGQRLVAYLACVARPVSRGALMGVLWPDAEPQRAHASLRTCLWRSRRVGPAVRIVGGNLELDAATEVDLHRGTAVAREVTRGDRPAGPDTAVLRLLAEDLLPHWYDEWLEPFRGHFHELRVRALEDVSRRLLRNGSASAAALAAGSAVAAEPLRDSAHWALIRALDAEGNHVEAVERYRGYVRLLGAELGVRPAASLAQILRGECSFR